MSKEDIERSKYMIKKEDNRVKIISPKEDIEKKNETNCRIQMYVQTEQQSFASFSRGDMTNF